MAIVMILRFGKLHGIFFIDNPTVINGYDAVSQPLFLRYYCVSNWIPGNQMPSNRTVLK